MNPTTPMSAGGSATLNNIPLKKHIQIQEVENGFIVNLGYGTQKIAASKDEVLQFISEFIDTK